MKHPSIPICEHAVFSPEFQERFWAKIAHSPGCWEWCALVTSKGYGRIDYHTSRGRISFRAHRVAWELVNGPIPPGKILMHSCDNPPCCNPAHLSLGTIKENTADAASKGLMARGERNNKAALTPSQVLEIRQRTDRTHAQLAEEFNVNPSCISKIKRRATWKHII